MSVLTDIKNRGVKDTFFLVCDGLKGLPDVVTNVWPLTTVQTCIIFPVRNTFRLASTKDGDALKRARVADLHGPECRGRAGGVGGAHGALGQEIRGDCAALGDRVGGVHSVSGLDERNPARDLLDQRHRIPERQVPARRQGPGSFPLPNAALMCLYLVTRSLDPTGAGKTRWAVRWKPALNAFAFPLQRPIPGS